MSLRSKLAIFFGSCAGYFLLATAGASAQVPVAPSNFFPDTNTSGRVTQSVVQISPASGAPNSSVWLKSRTTTASVYIPTPQAGQNITLRIIGGCDNAYRDTNGWYASTNYYMRNFNNALISGVVNSDSNCSGGDVYLSFSATSNARVVFGTHYEYMLVADAVGVEGATRYLNAFQIETASPGVVLGLSLFGVPCEIANYPNSCPTSPFGGSSVYTSLYGAPQPYSQYASFNLPAGCGVKNSRILLYDLDLNDASLGQNLNLAFWATPPAGSRTLVSSAGNAQLHAASQPVGSPFGAYNNQTLVFPSISAPVGYRDPYQLQTNTLYELEVSGLSNDNALQLYIDIDPVCNNPATPSCSAVSVVRWVDGSPTIRPGDRIRATVTVTNANGYKLGVNEPAYGPEYAGTDITNYLVTGGGWFARASGPITAAVQTITIDTIAYGPNNSQFDNPDVNPMNQPIYAPATAQNGVPFNWGLVLANFGWHPVTCSGSFNVVNPSPPPVLGCTNPAAANYNPAATQENGTCTYDVAPTISVSQYCSPPNYGITITVNDPDRNTNGLQPWINYSINGGGFVGARAGAGGSLNVAMPNPLASMTINANSNGINPTPPGGDAGNGSNVSTGVQTFQPCAYDFTVESRPNLPVMDDAENPTQVTFSSYAGVTTSAPQVAGLSIEREFFFNRGGTFDPATGTFSGVGSCVLTYGAVPSQDSAIVTVSAKLPSTQQVMTPAVRQVTNPPYTSACVNRPFRAGDYFCIREDIIPARGWVLRSTGAIIAGTTNGTVMKKSCVSVMDKPYMRIYGSDVYSGASFGSGCAATATNIFGSAKQSASGQWVGAGTQFGVFASGNVKGFISKSMRSPTRSNDLTFSNDMSITSATNPLADASRSGGLFGATFCSDDYWSSKNATLPLTTGVVPQLQTLATGQYQYSPGSTISASAPITNKIALYIDGDVTITGNGITTATSWGSLDTIASVYLIVRGNIYIAPSVTQLDGIYVAQPNASSPLGGGRIFTCTDNGATPSFAALTGACRSKLTVNGALVAARVNFMRSAGSLRTATDNEPYTSGNVAEVIRFTPEMFMSKPAGNSRPSVGTFDAVTSLPPSL